MSRAITIVAYIAILLTLPLPLVRAQTDYSASPYIFKLEVLTGASKSRVLTGFRLKGRKGIITALHGAVGAKGFRASNPAGKVFVDLVLTHVSIPEDVALLSSKELDAMSDEGLEAGDSLQMADGQRLYAIGSPEGASLYMKPVAAATPFARRLHQLLPTSDKSAAEKFVSRGSPTVQLSVISLDGELGPGYSGGPLLDEKGRVIGMIDGGLRAQYGIAWAVPLTIPVWEEESLERSALQILSTLRAPTCSRAQK